MLRVAAATAMLAMSSAFAHASCTDTMRIDVPAQAKSAGFTNLIFNSGSWNTLDSQINTGSGTPIWFNGLPYNSPSPSADLISNMCPAGYNSPVNFWYLVKKPSDPHDTSLTTFSRDGDHSKSRFFNKGYFEASLRSGGPTQALTTFFLYSSEHWRGTDGNHWCEIDIHERFFDQNIVGTVHDWQGVAPNVTNTQNTNSITQLPGVYWNAWHKVGLLWTQDTLTWYVDDVATHSWPTPSICNQQRLALIVGVLNNGPVSGDVQTHVQWVRVWR